MNSKGLIAVWLLFFIAIFCTMYLLTGYLVARVMADFSEPTVTGLTTLEVKPNYGTQTDQYTPIQPATTPIGKEL
jgi:hypothetical protein